MTAPFAPSPSDLEPALLARRGRREGQEIRFLCPAHKDTHPSARFHPGKRTWYCDACKTGGGARDLARRLGLLPELDNPRRPASTSAASPGGQILATYSYRDAAGNLLYQVLRKHPKSFACRRPAPSTQTASANSATSAVEIGPPPHSTAPDVSPSWIWNLYGVPRVLYRLPETLAAVAAGHTVFIAEGEKDADALAALGLDSTTNPGGAGKWRPAFVPALRGASVVILPDHDDAGHRHAHDVARHLAPAAREIRILPLPGLPPRGDVSDWIDARTRDGASPGDLRHELLHLAASTTPACAPAPTSSPGPTDAANPAIASSAPVLDTAGTHPCLSGSTHSSASAASPTPTSDLTSASSPSDATPASSLTPLPSDSPLHLPGHSATPSPGEPRLSTRLSHVTPKPVHYLWYPYIPLRKLTFLEGDPGQGKGWILLALAAAGSVGQGLPGIPPFEPFTTLIFTTEDDPEDTQRPRLDALGADCHCICTSLENLNLASPEGVHTLDHAIAEIRARLVILDPIADYLGPHTDMFRANEVSPLLRSLTALAHHHDCAILAVRHITKARSARSIYAGQGSISFSGKARSVLLAGSAAHDPDQRALVHTKSNVGPLGPACGYAITDNRFTWTGPSTLSALDLLATQTDGADRSAADDARDFLRTILASGPLPALQVLAAARTNGLSERTLKRAKAAESIRVLRQGFGTGSSWLWSLPTPTSPTPGEPLPDRTGPTPEEGLAHTWPPSPSSATPRPSHPSPCLADSPLSPDPSAPPQAAGTPDTNPEDKKDSELI